MVFLVIAITLFLFLKRFVYPDDAFDTINYHFFLGKDGFNSFPYQFKFNEFYPLGMHGFIPFVDMIGYFFYSFLGYRLGTLPSMLSIIGWTVIGYLIIKKISADYIKNKSADLIIVALLIFPVFVIQEGMFQVATYFTDNIYTFILMLFLFILLKFMDEQQEKRVFYYILSLGFLMGLIVTKLTNVIYIIPLSLFVMYEIYEKNKGDKFEINKKMLWLAAIYAILILVVNFPIFFNFSQTGNPIFPYYNGIFKSVYYPQTSWPFNYGPTTLSQRILYPFYAIKNPTMLGEVKDMFPDVKLLIIFFYVLIAFLFLLIKKKKFSKLEKVLLFIFFFSFFLWQIEFGYSRYGMFLEILGGIISIFLILKFFSEKNGRLFLGVLSFLYIAYMLYQSVNICMFNYKYDVSWRPTPSLDEWERLITSPKIFQKYTKINGRINKELKNVDIVIQCVSPSTTYSSTIKDLENKPVVTVDRGSDYALSDNESYANRRDRIIANYFNKKTLKFAIVFNESGGPDGGNAKSKCFDAINQENKQGEKINIEKSSEVGNFIGDSSFKLSILTGEYYIK
jgi:hypothetical protein